MPRQKEGQSKPSKKRSKRNSGAAQEAEKETAQAILKIDGEDADAATGHEEEGTTGDVGNGITAGDEGVEDEMPLFSIDTERVDVTQFLTGHEEDEKQREEEEDDRKGQGKHNQLRDGAVVAVDVNKTEDELMLERLVFGGRDAAEIFAGPEEGQGDDEELEGAGKSTGQRRPAWQDDDDANVRVNIANKNRLRKLREAPDEEDISGKDYQERLRARFQQSSVSSAVQWAKLTDKKKGRKRRLPPDLSSDDSDVEADRGPEADDDDGVADLDLFSTTAPLTMYSKQKLQPTVLEVLRLRDANLQEPSKAVVQEARFHPTTTGLMLVAGMDKTLRFFQVDGRDNPKVAGVFFPDLPIQCAGYVGEGGFNEVVVSGRRPFFYSYDLASGSVTRVARLMGRDEKALEKFATSPDGKWIAFTGKDGYVVLVSAQTKQVAHELKMNGTAHVVCFSGDGSELLASGGDAVVYRWDLRSQRCLSRFRNEGGTGTSSLACMGPTSNGYTAVGAACGVVNVYSNADIMYAGGASEVDVKPLKAIMNLTTTVSRVRFNHDGQVLAIASKYTRDALKMVHVPTLSVFSNWPTGQTPIRYASAMDFSPNSGYLAVGNDRGRVLLYRLKHYDAV